MPARPVLALFVVGLLLLPGPVYAGVVDSLDRDRIATGYGAERVDFDDPATRERLVERFADDVTVTIAHVAEPYVVDEFRAQNRTVRVLRRAYRGNGSVRVTDEAVRADVTDLARNASFLRPDFDHEPRRLVVGRRDDALLVGTRATTASERFAAVREATVVRFDALSPAERATVEKVLNASLGEDRGYYRPYRNEPHPFPAVVERDGDYYLVRPVVTVDDFGPDGFLVGLAGSGVGLVCLLGAVAAAFVERVGNG
jgi:hypothetical protein